MRKLTMFLIDWITSTEAKFDTEFMSMTSAFWSGYYAIFLTPFIIWLIFLGFKIMYRVKAETLIKERDRALAITFFMVVGFTALPVIEGIGKELNNVVSKGGQNFIESFAKRDLRSVNERKRQAILKYGNHVNTQRPLDLSSDDDVNGFFSQMVQNSGGIGYFVLANACDEEAANQYRCLSENQAKTVNDIMERSGRALELSAIQAADAEAQKKADRIAHLSPDSMIGQEGTKITLWDLDVVDIITMFFELLGTVMMVFMRCIRLFLLAFSRFTFPIALALSYIPTCHDTWKAWLDSYKTIILWSVVIILIGVITQMTTAIFIVSNDSLETRFMGAIFVLLFGLLYLLSPTITVINFGGSQAISGMPSQIWSSAAGMYGIGKSLWAMVLPPNARDKIGQAIKNHIQSNNAEESKYPIISNGSGNSEGNGNTESSGRVGSDA